MKLRAMVMKNVLDLILTGTLKPGEKLPAAAQIAKDNDVSITCAREALQQLEAMGLLEIEHGRGIFVTSGNPIHEDILNARKALEYSTIKFAAINITSDEIELLDNLLDRMDKMASNEDLISFVECDHLFHLTIAKAAKNRILSRIMENVKDIFYYQQTLINAYPGNMKNAVQHHKLILDALKKRDSDLALYWMTDHLEGAYKVWSEVIEEMLNSNGIMRKHYIETASKIFNWSLNGH